MWTNKESFNHKRATLVDGECNNRLKYCCVQLDLEKFIVWNFEREYYGDMNQGWPWTEVSLSMEIGIA